MPERPVDRPGMLDGVQAVADGPVAQGMHVDLEPLGVQGGDVAGESSAGT